MTAWVRAWALGLQGQHNPRNRCLYTPGNVATLSGDLIRERAVRGWWREAAPQAPPPPARRPTAHPSRA
jgi:hypothetical protein